jgi:hypothetical protein
LGLKTVPGTEDWARDRGGPLMISGDGGRTCIALFEGPPVDAIRNRGFRRVAFGVSGAEFVAFVEFGRSMGLDMSVQDHVTTVSVYFRDPYGHDLEVTTRDHEHARSATLAK